MWDCTLGGTAPNSPSIISLLVLILTFRIHFKYQRNTFSISWFAFDDTPHTSLPYNSFGFVNVSKVYIINLGGRTPIFLNFFNMRNIAFWLLSERNFELSLKNIPRTYVYWTNDISSVFVWVGVMNSYSSKCDQLFVPFTKHNYFGF